MRPKYETAEDAENESVAAMVIEGQSPGTKVIWAPEMSSVDFFLTDTSDDELWAVCEYKRRHKKYDTLMIGKEKIDRLYRIADLLGAVPLLFIEWDDGLYQTSVRATYPTHIGGRLDRGDRADIEECYYIPIEDFDLVMKREAA